MAMIKEERLLFEVTGDYYCGGKNTIYNMIKEERDYYCRLLGITRRGRKLEGEDYKRGTSIGRVEG